jgi:hypothetical protein
MKKVSLGLLVSAVLMAVAWEGLGQRSEAIAQHPQTPAATGDLVVFPITMADKAQGQLLAVVEPKQQVMSVYRIDPVSGKIALKSVRNLHWDLEMTYYNNEAPLPQDIKTSLEQR